MNLDLKLFLFKNFYDWMPALGSSSLYSLLDLIDLGTLGGDFPVPMYIPRVLGLLFHQ